MDGAAIQEGSKVIIKRDSYLRLEEICMKKKVSMQKLNFVLGNAIGCPYGSTFVVKDGQLCIKKPCDITANQLKTGTSGENNQFINDNGTSQKLSKDEIMALKADGIKGEDIIDQLVENSESFDKKTEFSQEKYLKKKKKRHIPEITILKPTLPLVCEMLYANSPGKIMDLRMDTVSQILTMANIQSNINVLLVENTQSFLAGVILHRMGGVGNLIQLYNGDFPVRLCLGCFDLEKKDLEILNGFPMSKINALKRQDLVSQASSTPPYTTTATSEEISSTKEHQTVELSEAEGENGLADCHSDWDMKSYHKVLTNKEKILRKKHRDNERTKASEVLKNYSMDSLIIATKFRTKTVLLELIDFLAPSRPVVVYSPHKEVLMECYVALKQLQNVLLLNLTETWWRSYQGKYLIFDGVKTNYCISLSPRKVTVIVARVFHPSSIFVILEVLSMRTHPQIMMDSSGGYLLTGIKVDTGQVDSTDMTSSQSPTKKMKTS